jgi:hypothetical protein
MRTWPRILLAVFLLTGLLRVEAPAHGAGDHTHAGEERVRSGEANVPKASDVEPVAAVAPVAPGDFEQLLDARLRPLEGEVRKLREAVERPGLAEIVGGVGWIAGLAALAYAWKRRGRG